MAGLSPLDPPVGKISVSQLSVTYRSCLLQGLPHETSPISRMVAEGSVRSVH